MLVVGPTGAGKSVLLALIALQFRRYGGSQLYIFDKGYSARAAVLAMGGAHHALGLGADSSETLAFQPLRRIDDQSERSWAAEWIAALLAHEKVIVTPEVKDAVWAALTSLASAPREERTLTGLATLLQSNRLRQAIQPYTLAGPHGRLLDADADRLGDVRVVGLVQRVHALDSGLLERRPYSERPPRYEYVLTARGQDFLPVIAALSAWGNKHCSPKGTDTLVVSRKGKKPIEPIVVDKKTGAELSYSDVLFAAGPAATKLKKMHFLKIGLPVIES
jgi:hypothetical protein